MITPTLNYEKELTDKGYKYIAGVDEAGRGAWAGPIVASAVIMPKDNILTEARDSKLLPEAKREELFAKIKKTSIAWAVGIIDIDFINKYNIGKANIKVFVEAINNLSINPDYVLVDGILKLNNNIEYMAIKDGDALVYSIACASIIAKVTRDNILKELDLQFPCYEFARHKGYGTKVHRQALEKYGICQAHRILYKPIQKIIKK